MLGRDSAGCRDLLRGAPHRPCVPAAVRAAPGTRSPGRPARDPCLRSRGREGVVVPCLRNHRLRLAPVLSLRVALGSRLPWESPERGTRVPAAAAAAAKACVSAPAPSGLSARNPAQRSCIPRSVPGRGLEAPGPRSSVRCGQRRATVPSFGPWPPGRALCAPLRSPTDSLCPSGNQRPAAGRAPLFSRVRLLQTALGPHLGAACRSRAARDLSAAVPLRSQTLHRRLRAALSK